MFGEIENQLLADGNSDGLTSTTADSGALKDAGVSKKRTMAERAVDDLAALIEKTSTDETMEKHWEQQKRARDWNSLMTRLVKHAKKVGKFIHDHRATELSDQAFKLQESLEARQNFLDRYRHDAAALLENPLSEVDWNILKKGPFPFFHDKLANTGMKLVEKATSCEKSAAALVSVINCCAPPPLAVPTSLNLGLTLSPPDGQSEGATAKAVLHTQKNIVMATFPSLA